MPTIVDLDEEIEEIEEQEKRARSVKAPTLVGYTHAVLQPPSA